MRGHRSRWWCESAAITHGPDVPLLESVNVASDRAQTNLECLSQTVAEHVTQARKRTSCFLGESLCLIDFLDDYDIPPTARGDKEAKPTHVESMTLGRASNRCCGRGHPVTQRPPRFFSLNIFQELSFVLIMDTPQHERKSR